MTTAGVDLNWMLSRDLLIAVLAGVVFAVMTWMRGRPLGSMWRVTALGVYFALLPRGSELAHARRVVGA